MITRNLGGDRLGTGNKMNVAMHGYERSTHDLSYLWRSTMSAGTLVPFMSEVALPGDTFDITLDCDIKTHPTEGPLFGSYKVQHDVFVVPVRLYQGALHNNQLGIGLKMNTIFLPKVTLESECSNPASVVINENSQINPSCIFSYLNIRGIGTRDGGGRVNRDFNAIPYLAYWDIYKNYYANKQENVGAVIHTPRTTRTQTVSNVVIRTGSVDVTINTVGNTNANAVVAPSSELRITFSGATPSLNEIVIYDVNGNKYNPLEIWGTVQTTATLIRLTDNKASIRPVAYWGYITADVSTTIEPQVKFFPLGNIDKMRENILKATPAAVTISKTTNLEPYHLPLLITTDGISNLTNTQEGLALKTYQSDLNNNWLSTESIDGINGISAVTAINTSGGSFTIDTLNLSKKVYDMLNRIAVSGGSYKDWIDTVYKEVSYWQVESPVYMGGLIKELVFQEVVSNSAANTENQGDQPLGQLAGRGVMAKKHKGGHITVKVEEPSYIIGIISLTPRVDYSQGNKWDTNLKTMDDFHKPALDQIGFQDKITDTMDWRDTKLAGGSVVNFKSAGKQPAWVNYMSNVNVTRGNFAIPENEMFMTLNRRYEYNPTTQGIKDLTTYIDPKKFNNIFAQTSLDAQNFWAQIAVNITARRKMSAKIMPNL